MSLINQSLSMLLYFPCTLARQVNVCYQDNQLNRCRSNTISDNVLHRFQLNTSPHYKNYFHVIFHNQVKALNISIGGVISDYSSLCVDSLDSQACQVNPVIKALNSTSFQFTFDYPIHVSFVSINCINCTNSGQSIMSKI